MNHPAGLTVTTPNDREIVMTRWFDAPRRLVFEAMIRPELLRRWMFGPPGWTLAECEVDARVGGRARYVWRGPDGNGFGMTSVCHEFVPNERIRTTETFDMGGGPEMPSQEATLVLAEHGARTLLTITLGYPNRETRDGALASGMEHGMAAGYDRLDGVLVAGATGGA